MKIALITLMCVPGLAFAAGSDSSTPKPPTTTQTTQSCTGAQVWDSSKKKCVNPKGTTLDADTLYDAVRELAYANRAQDAQAVLSVMPDQSEGRVLTYWGFTHRKLGNLDLAQTFYDRAIQADPDNLLARSYMGQGHVEAGRMMAAKTQLREIRARGGAGTWPETSLAQAIASGETYNY